MTPDQRAASAPPDRPAGPRVEEGRRLIDTVARLVHLSAAGQWLQQAMQRAGLAVVLALALTVRLYRLLFPGIWSDEGFSIFLARSSLPDLMAGTANDVHPPLFYLLLKTWLLPGFSDLYARLFPVFFGVLTVALLYHVGRRLFSRATGWWAALYLALAPMHIAYSREIRQYIVLVLFAFLSLYLAWRCLQDPFPLVWAAYVAATLAALYTESIGLLIIPVQNVVALALIAGARRWQTLRTWLAVQGLVLLGFLPWLPVAAYQALFHMPSWVGPATVERLGFTFPHLLFGEPNLGREGAWQGAAYLWFLVALLAVLMALRGRARQGARLWAALVPLLLAACLLGAALSLPIYQHKQFLMLSLPLALLAGLGTAGLPRWTKFVLLVFFLALAAPSLQNLYARHELADHPAQEQWKELAAYIDAHARPGDAMVLNPGAAAPVLDLYLRARLDRLAYPMTYNPQVGNFAGQVTTPELIDERLQPLGTTHGRIWLVQCCLPTFWDPEGYLPAWLASWGQAVAIPSFSGIDARLYERK